jgi:hypothetical protein
MKVEDRADQRGLKREFEEWKAGGYDGEWGYVLKLRI